MSKNVVVVIPHYNRWDLTHPRLWELYKHERDTIKSVLVVDDESTDTQTTGGLRFWADFRTKTDFIVNAIRPEENLGFLKASNFGLQYEGIDEDDILILFSNDVIIRGKFIEQIVDILTNNPLSLIGGILYSRDTGWNSFGGRVFPYVEGWLLATYKKNWEDLGYFDEQYAPSDFEDVDLSTKALEKGYELVPLNNINISHIGGQTIQYGDAREKITHENKKKFGEKWIK